MNLHVIKIWKESNLFLVLWNVYLRSRLIKQLYNLFCVINKLWYNQVILTNSTKFLVHVIEILEGFNKFYNSTEFVNYLKIFFRSSRFIKTIYISLIFIQELNVFLLNCISIKITVTNLNDKLIQAFCSLLF